jgi:hypothetical protein
MEAKRSVRTHSTPVVPREANIHVPSIQDMGLGRRDTAGHGESPNGYS